MCRTLLLLFGVVWQVAGQIPVLATTGDGAVLQFSSGLWLKGEPLVRTPQLPPPTVTRIYQHATPPVLAQTAAPGRALEAPYLSTDGQTKGSFSYIPCFPCRFYFPRNVVTLERAGRTQEFVGDNFRVSRNGRFVLNTGYLVSTSPGSLRDLDTDRTYDFGRNLPRWSQMLTDAGGYLSLEFGQPPTAADTAGAAKVWLHLLDQQPEVIFESNRVILSSISAAVTAAGNFAFVMREETAGRFRLLEVDVATRARRELWEGAAPLAFSADADGRRLILQTKEQLLLWDRSAGWRTLFAHEAGLASTLLTDNGEVVFATTRANAIYRVDANTGDAVQLYAPFPVRARQASFGAYPGSLMRLEVDYTDPKLRFHAGDFMFPVVKAEDNIFDVQIPWEFTEAKGRNEPYEVTSEDSPFSLRGEAFFAREPSPWLFTYLPEQGRLGPFLVAAQADFASLVTPDHPAPAGGLIHFWATGLGPLNRPLATGQAGPADPPAVPLEPFACYLRGGATQTPARGLRVPTVIYAPNLVGVYQIDVEIPADWPAGRFDLNCTGRESSNTVQVAVGPRR